MRNRGLTLIALMAIVAAVTILSALSLLLLNKPAEISPEGQAFQSLLTASSAAKKYMDSCHGSVVMWKIPEASSEFEKAKTEMLMLGKAFAEYEKAHTEAKQKAR